MRKYYYYVANVFKDGGVTVTNGTHNSSDGNFQITQVMKDIANDNGVKITKVVVLFFAEISEEEFNRFEEIVKNEG